MQITREEAINMADAHSEGLHAELPREGCPECEGRPLTDYPLAGDKPTWVSTYDMELDDFARPIASLPHATREIVLDALRVRGMDFVQDRLKLNDGAADLAADIYRHLDPGADSNGAFDPNAYGQE
jgi:hypothetical protein